MKRTILGAVLAVLLGQFSAPALALDTCEVGCLSLVSNPSPNGTCHSETNFKDWQIGVMADAINAGVSTATLTAAARCMCYNPKFIHSDSTQAATFQGTWLDWLTNHKVSSRVTPAARVLQQKAGLFQQIEAKYGVPGSVLVTFWSFETSFGADKGKLSSISAATTLAYDCRRADEMRKNLIDDLLLLEKGPLSADQMVGSWAGEMGHFQMMPAVIKDYGQDGDGDGRIDVINSMPDAMATAANFLQSLGWEKGQPWIEEVRVPVQMDWRYADLRELLSRSQWRSLGVVQSAEGQLPNDNVQAALFLPMGRLGPAFLVYNNFLKGFMGWNKSWNYALSLAYLANRIDAYLATGNVNAGGVSMANGSPESLTSYNDILELQQKLIAHQWMEGTADGQIGPATRDAARKAQVDLRLPADGYPDQALLRKLRGI